MKIKRFEEFIKEDADYRNVTGHGTMGNASDQNTGPSFNKGPYSATYRQPSIIGLETDDFNDPYFSQNSEIKRKKPRKNPKVEKNRRQKSRFFDKIDKKTQNKIF